MWSGVATFPGDHGVPLASVPLVLCVRSRKTTCQRLIYFPSLKKKKKKAGHWWGRLRIKCISTGIIRWGHVSDFSALRAVRRRPRIRRGTRSRCFCWGESDLRRFVTYIRHFPRKSVLGKYICSRVELSTAFGRLLCPLKGVWGHGCGCVAVYTVETAKDPD